MPPPNQQAVAQLTPWQQKLFANQTLAQIKKNNPKAYAAYTAAGQAPAAAAPGAPRSARSGGCSCRWRRRWRWRSGRWWWRPPHPRPLRADGQEGRART